LFVAHSERCITGDAFKTLTREDFSLIFPQNEKFLLGSNLYKISQSFREVDMELFDDDNASHYSFNSTSRNSSVVRSRTSTPSSSSSIRMKRKTPETSKELLSTEFKLPIFSPDIKLCIQRDAFYTSAQRNRLIKESCMALRGYCWEREIDISNVEKRRLAKLVLQLAPKSLGDVGSSSPEVCVY
jgi:hypothetical protein